MKVYPKKKAVKKVAKKAAIGKKVAPVAVNIKEDKTDTPVTRITTPPVSIPTSF